MRFVSYECGKWVPRVRAVWALTVCTGNILVQIFCKTQRDSKITREGQDVGAYLVRCDSMISSKHGHNMRAAVTQSEDQHRSITAAIPGMFSPFLPVVRATW